MNDVDLLRRAAALMREQHGPEHVRYAFWSAVANWLDYMAPQLGLIVVTGSPSHARAIARAYLVEPMEQVTG